MVRLFFCHRSASLWSILKGIAKPILWTSVTAFALFTTAAGLRLLHGFDLWAFRVAQARTSGLFDAAGEFFSTVGGIELTTVALLLLLTMLFFSGRRVLAGRILIVFLVTSVIEVAMKMWLPQVPLPEVYSRSDGHTPLVAIDYPYPYPSGHMLRATILLGAVFVLWKNRVGRVLLFIALIGMALSRVYMGVHWASDVIGGALLGVAGLAWAFGRRKGG